jgi:hypothetical protein
MTDIIEKARLGRVAALASLSGKPGSAAACVGDGARARAFSGHEKVVFFSSRTRRNQATFFG